MKHIFPKTSLIQRVRILGSHFFFCLAFFAALAPVRALAAENESPHITTEQELRISPKNVIAVNSLMLSMTILDVTYERVVDKNWSWTLVSAVKMPLGSLPILNLSYLIALKVGGGVKWYPFGAAPSGLFLNPSLAAWAGTSANYGGFGAMAQVSAMVGYAWIIQSFNLTLGAGAQYLSLAAPDAHGTSRAVGWILPAAEVTVGYAF